MSIKSPKNTYAGSFVSPFWCFLCNKIVTVVSEAPLRLSLLRLRPLGEVLTFVRVARSDRALPCSPEHWSTECLFCKHRYNKTVIKYIYLFNYWLYLLPPPPRGIIIMSHCPHLTFISAIQIDRHCSSTLLSGKVDLKGKFEAFVLNDHSKMGVSEKNLNNVMPSGANHCKPEEKIIDLLVPLQRDGKGQRRLQSCSPEACSDLSVTFKDTSSEHISACETWSQVQ